MKKATKIISIIGGLFVFSEIFGIIGEAQALCGMRSLYPDETDALLILCKKPEELDIKNPYTIFKCKAVAKLTELLCESF